MRSQDKTRLVKVCSLEYAEYNEIHYINGYCVNEVDNYDLGTYKTKERALKVLDEIQKYITPTLSLLDDTLNGKQVCQVGNILSMIYEMPKE